jgi:hypothetical protein
MASVNAMDSVNIGPPTLMFVPTGVHAGLVGPRCD